MRLAITIALLGLMAGGCVMPADTGISLSCEDPVPLQREGDLLSTSLETCADGLVQRRGSELCEKIFEPGTCNLSDGPHYCESDTDCAERPNGRCARQEWDCACHYGCTSDDDCSADEACSCAVWPNSVSRCVPAGCRSDSDCESGVCARWSFSAEDSGPYYSCLPLEAECRVNEDCPGFDCSSSLPDPESTGLCLASKGWRCGGHEEVCAIH